MNKKFAKYMKYGKLVKNINTDESYKLVEDMCGEKDIVKAVNCKNLARYDLLCAWIRNWDSVHDFRERFTQDIEECRKEKSSYEEYITIADVTPHNKVKFITSNYKTLFEVTDLEAILVNSKDVRVNYLDDTHFEFIGKGFGFGALHICQFAEMREKNVTSVEPILFAPGMKIIGTKEADEYEGMTGFVSHIKCCEEKETENEGPDIYCTFDEPTEHSTPNKSEIEARFLSSYGEPEDDIWEFINLDEVIMAPHMIQAINTEN